MNILEQEDIIKGLPDQALMKEASAPSGQVPQFLVVSEIKRRSDMRKRYQEQQQQPQGTVKDQIVMEAMGIGGVMPPQMASAPQPMGPAGAPPMGGMPPMAPPMPQGGIASVPPAMPPMGMAQGGIVRMQQGGPTDLLDLIAAGASPVELLRRGYTEEQIRAANAEYRARMSAPIEAVGGIQQIQDSPTRTSQMGYGDQYDPPFIRGITDRMPSLSGVSPEQAKIADVYGGSGMPSLSERGADALAVLGGGDMARARTEIASNTLLPPDIQAPNPPGMMGLRTFDTGVFSDLSEGIAGIMPENPARSVKDFILGPFADNREMIAAADRARPMVEDMGQARADEQARLLADLQLDALDDAQVQGKTDATVQSTGQNRPQTEQNIVPATDGTEPSVVASAVDAVADLQLGSGPADQRASTPDDGLYGGAISSIDQMIADLSGRETQASPVLDLSDVIERSRKGTLAETFMRLGAGVAGGDISKGIAGAADAASKGRQELSRLEMAERIAKTKAGQEDIRRGEQRDLDVAKLGLQREQLNILATRYKNELEKAASVGRNELFRTASAVIDAAMEGSMIMDPAERQAKVYELMNEFLTLYAPTFGVTNLPKLPTGGTTPSGERPALTAFEGG